MNLYLHYGVGHKQSVLRSKTRLNLTQSKLSNTRKHLKQNLSSEENTTRDNVCSTRAATGRSPAVAEHHKPSGATRHGNRDGTWPLRAAQGVKNTLARDDHAPITGELSGRSKQCLN
jgi:hypothetical protein